MVLSSTNRTGEPLSGFGGGSARSQDDSGTDANALAWTVVWLAGRRAALDLASLIEKEKVEPFPGLLTTWMEPPIISTSLRQMANPRPLPPKRRVVDVSAWLKDWNNFFW